MNHYQAIANIYDSLMGHVDYEKWVEGLVYRWQQLELTPKKILDAGCGTGNLLLPLARLGYNIYGIDNSAEMLAICQDKLFSQGQSAVLLEMDIRKIILPGNVDAVICFCDTLNYLTREGDLKEAFTSIYQSLKPGGNFIFDLRTPYYYENILADHQWVEREDDVVLIWENDFSQKPLMNMQLTFFLKQGAGENIYQMHVEEHQQRCYQVEEIKDLLKEVGFRLMYLGADLFDEPLDLEKEERMYFMACKQS